MSGAFSGLLEAAIAKMSGLGGYNGWRWIFLLEGALTVILGLAFFFILPDSPSQSSRWLSEHEIRYLNALYRKYRGIHAQQERSVEETTKNPQNWKVAISVLTDWQIYL